MLDTDAWLDRRAKHLAAITPHVPVFVCRNLLILADRDMAAENPAKGHGRRLQDRSPFSAAKVAPAGKDYSPIPRRIDAANG
jgi:hypothetical protein